MLYVLSLQRETRDDDAKVPTTEKEIETTSYVVAGSWRLAHNLTGGMT